MKFKHGIMVGFFTGFFLACSGIAARELKHEREQKGKLVGNVLDAYNEGWIKGKNWSIFYHEAHHPDCTRCPH